MNQRRCALLAGGLIGGLVGSVALAEGAIRLATVASAPLAEAMHDYDPMAVQIEPMGQLGYRQRPNALLHYRNGTTASTNSLGYRGPEVRSTPRAGTIRVILLGGSTTHGFGVGDYQTIDAYMREILAKRHPGVRFEVVNLAFDGYDSYELLERFRLQGVSLKPNIVVFNEGINDVRNAWFPNLAEADPRTLIWGDVVARLREERARGGPRPWTLMKHYSYLARTPAYVHDQFLRRHAQNRKLESDAVSRSADSDSRFTFADSQRPPYPEAAELFDKHVRELTALAVAHGASVILSTPPSALRSFPPAATSTRSYWLYDAKTTQRYRDELSRRLRVIAAQEYGLGGPVRYVAAAVPQSAFLDDCHLNAVGNRFLAEALSDEIDSILAAPKSR